MKEEKKKLWEDKLNISIAIFIIIIIFVFGFNYFSREAPEISELKESESLITSKSVLEISDTELTSSYNKEINSPESEITEKIDSIIVTPSKINAGDLITIKVGPPSGNKGYENKITFYATNNIRVSQITACKDSSYCHTEFEKKYKTGEYLTPGEYNIKIYDMDLKEYITGYFMIII